MALTQQQLHRKKHKRQMRRKDAQGRARRRHVELGRKAHQPIQVQVPMPHVELEQHSPVPSVRLSPSVVVKGVVGQKRGG